MHEILTGFNFCGTWVADLDPQHTTNTRKGRLWLISLLK